MPEWAELDPWADIGFHLIPALALTIDLLFFSPPWTVAALPAMGISSVLAFGYWFWVELCYRNNGWYPYPLFDVLTPAWRVVLFAGSALVMTFSTATLKWVYAKINGYGISEIQMLKAKPGDGKS
ncbi:MAG: hypothetical protein MMC33_005742 [Icmadophila ericetorum]|nr:hypothetical protein [Icmadophila ericetorum]